MKLLGGEKERDLYSIFLPLSPPLTLPVNHKDRGHVPISELTHLVDPSVGLVRGVSGWIMKHMLMSLFCPLPVLSLFQSKYLCSEAQI